MNVPGFQLDPVIVNAVVAALGGLAGYWLRHRQGVPDPPQNQAVADLLQQLLRLLNTVQTQQTAQEAKK